MENLNEALNEVQNENDNKIRCFRVCLDGEFCGMVIPAFAASQVLNLLEQSSDGDFFKIETVYLTEEELEETFDDDDDDDDDETEFLE